MDLFTDLTSSRAHQLLQKIRSASAFAIFLENEKIQLNYKNNEWIFPRGVCKSVQNKIIKKIQELKVIPPSNLLELDPASDPDDIPPSIDTITHPPGNLSFDDEEGFNLQGINPWIPKMNELHTDE